MLSRGTLVCTLARVFLIMHARAYIWYCILSHIKLFTSNHMRCARIISCVVFSGEEGEGGEGGSGPEPTLSNISAISNVSTKIC